MKNNSKLQNVKKILNKLFSEYILIMVCFLVFIVSVVCIIARPTYKRTFSINDNMMLTDSEVNEFVCIYDDCIVYDTTGFDLDADNEKIKNSILIARSDSAKKEKLRFGVYDLHIEYETEYETTSKFNADPVCHIMIEGDAPNILHSEPIFLQNSRTWLDSQIYVTSPRGIKGYTVYINCGGIGYCKVKYIELSECTAWKFGFITVELFLLVIICLWYYKYRKLKADVKLKILVGIITVCFASIPALPGRIYTLFGDDLNFHLVRIGTLANELKYGHIPALIQTDIDNNFWNINFIMYGNAFLYFPALMHILGLPISTCYNIYIILVNTATYCICRYCMGKLFHNNKIALCGTLLYMLAPYRISNLYLRAAVGEYTAMVFFPLIIYGFYKLYYSEGTESAPIFINIIPIIIGVSGLIETHVPSIIIWGEFILLFVLINWKKTLRLIPQLFVAFVSIIAVNAFFIVPFIDCYISILRNKTITNPMELYNSCTTPLELLSFFTCVKDIGSANSPHSLGFAFIIGAFLFTIISIKKNTDFEKPKSIVGQCFMFGIIAIFLSSSFFPWYELYEPGNILQKIFVTIEYPYRYLSAATIFFVVVTAYSLNMLSVSNKIIFNITLCILILISVITLGMFYSTYACNTIKIGTLSVSHSDVGDSSYYPASFDAELIYDVSIHQEPNDSAIIKKLGNDNKNNKLYYVESVENDCIVTLPVVYYRFLTVTNLENGKYVNTYSGYNGQLAVKLNKGFSGNLLVSYNIKLLWKFSYIVSVISFIIIIFYLIIVKNDKKPYVKRYTIED